MDIKDILTLIDAVSKSRLSSFTYEEGNAKLHFEAKCEEIEMAITSGKNIIVEENKSSLEQEDSACYKLITSPMVGTFYSSGTEDGEAFVSVGDRIKKGQVVGIVEAMKLMNEIESPYDGIVETILVKNKEMIGFGQELIKIRIL